MAATTRRNSLPIFTELVSHSMGLQSPTPHQAKRNCIYFPAAGIEKRRIPDTVELTSRAPACNSFEAALMGSGVYDVGGNVNVCYDAPREDLSTWEFVSPVASPIAQSFVVSEPEGPTAAQEVATRYRAGLEIDLGPPARPASAYASSDASSTLSAEDGDDVSTISSFGSIPFPVERDFNMRPTFQASRTNALLDIREEVAIVMRQGGLGPHDPVVCHRYDCRDTLPNMKAFIYHLHIHNLHDMAYACDDCGKRFEAPRLLALHNCPRHASSCPSSPVRDTIMRVLSRIKSHE